MIAPIEPTREYLPATILSACRAISNNHGYLGKSMVSLQDTIDEIKDAEDDEN